MSSHAEHRQAIADLNHEVVTLVGVINTQQGSMEELVRSMEQLNDIARMHNEVLETHTQRLRELNVITTDLLGMVAGDTAPPAIEPRYSEVHGPVEDV